MKKLNVAIIGAKFMGKAHSSSWSRVRRFFDTPVEPVLKVACGRPDERLQEFADRWGWQSISMDWNETVNRPDVDIVDIAAPTFLHHDVAIEAAKAGKHVFCEKPLCLMHEQAVEMYAVAQKAGIAHYLNHNYRRCPRSREPSSSTGRSIGTTVPLAFGGPSELDRGPGVPADLAPAQGNGGLGRSRRS